MMRHVSLEVVHTHTHTHTHNQILLIKKSVLINADYIVIPEN